MSDEQEKDIKTMEKVNYELFMGANAIMVNGKRQNNNQCVSSLSIYREKKLQLSTRYVLSNYVCREPDGLTFFPSQIKKLKNWMEFWVGIEYNQF